MTTKKRNKLRAILIIFLLIIIPLGNRFVFAQGSIRSAKKILVLLSLEANRPIQVLFSSTFRQEMNRRSSHPYEVNYENLDLARFRDKTYKDNLKEIIDQKYSVHQPDIIIIFLLHAAGFVAEYNLFPGIPKIYITPRPRRRIRGRWEFYRRGPRRKPNRRVRPNRRASAHHRWRD